jgi:FkbM family methyltransferase
MIESILRHLRRVANAREFGVPFSRRATFEMPAAVRLGRRTVNLAFPEEHGILVDFLTCFIEDEYGLGTIKTPVRTIVDIGANVGFFSMAASARFPFAQIHAYEPNRRIFPYLSKNAKQAGVQVYCEAVGATAGWVKINDTGDSNQATTSPAAKADDGIPRVSLAEVVARIGGTIDLAKIDCEGAEWEMFTDRASWRHIKSVRMEYHLWKRRTYAEVEEAFRGIHFRILHHSPGGEWGTIWAQNTQA